MLKRIRWIFEYYAAHHLEISMPSRKIKTADDTAIAVLEEVKLRQGQVRIHGWCLSERLTLRLGEVSIVRRPTVERNDVAHAMGCDSLVGFQVNLPLGPGRLSIRIDGKSHEPVEIEIPLPGSFAVSFARWRLWWRFAFRMARLSPMVLSGLLRHDPRLKNRIKTALEIDSAPDIRRLDNAVLANRSSFCAGSDEHGVTIILPVHNAFDLLPDVLDRVVHNTEIKWRLIVIEDCSTDTRVRPWLRSWAEKTGSETTVEIELIENAENRGFIASVNTGLTRAREYGDPVLLLNSDALLPPCWATRLLGPIWADANVASVTPMSNDAEIFSVPVICTRCDLAPGQGTAIDAAAARLCLPNPPVAATTGVGFCMAINRHFLERVPQLDMAFGRGYGEEVDWCRKTAAQGGRHVAASNLFVEHRGGESFGSEEKQRLITQNNAEIARRYPEYDSKVQDFILRDPLLTPRLALALAFLDSLPDVVEVPVFMAHSMGGGAETYLQHRLQRLDPVAAVVLRMGSSYRCRIEVHTPAGRIEGGTDDLELVTHLVTRLSRRRIIYSCAVGDTDPVSLPGFLQELADGAPLEFLFHDYFPLSPSYTLLDSDRVYRGTPLPPRDDPAHHNRRADGGLVPLDQWQAAWGGAIATAERLVVFSNDSHARVASVYPDAASRITLKPHDLPHDIPGIACPEGKRLVIGVLGNIGPQKGAAVVQALSQRINEGAEAGLVLLGRIDPSFPLARNTSVHGPYEHGDIPALVQRYGITTWLIPSIWPETFSYTTHECLATGLPVLTFDLGAQGEAAARAPNGHVMTLPREVTASSDLAETVLVSARSVTMTMEGEA